MSKTNRNDALSESLWQDRDILFDLDLRLLRPIPGEIIIERIDNVEDTKGNNGDQGHLRITNLRLVWYAISSPRINLSIGWMAIYGITTKNASSRIRGEVNSLYLMCRSVSETRFEFVFTSSASNSNKLFTTVIGIHRAYETSKMYREIKMRSALITEDGKLKLLPLETQCDKFDGTWNLSTDEGTLGTIIVTNIRVIWYGELNNTYNASIPYLQIRSCRIRDSRFGHALVIDTALKLKTGDLILGFRIDPIERLEHICKCIQTFFAAFNSKPIFGIQYRHEDLAVVEENVETKKTYFDEENEDETDENSLRIDPYAAYFSDGTKDEEPRAIVYSEELGVAIEQLKSGFTISELWELNIE